MTKYEKMKDEYNWWVTFNRAFLCITAWAACGYLGHITGERWNEQLNFPTRPGYVESYDIKIRRYHPDSFSSIPVISIRGIEYLVKENPNGEPVLKKAEQK